MKKRSGKTVGAKSRARVRTTRPAARAPLNAIFLVGFMGAGKSSVGRALGQRLNWVFEDLDDRIERREGRTVARIFRDSGEAEFRRAEYEALRQLLEELRGGVAMVIALGGGTFAQAPCQRAVMSSGVRSVFLDAPLLELWNRCEQQSGAVRPLQKSKDIFRDTYNARLPAYQAATLRVETGGKKVEMIAAEIAEKLGLKEIEIRTEQGEVE